MKPPLKRFKMKEAHTWSEEQWNERLPLFYAAIERYASAGVSLLIPYQECLRLFAGMKYGRNPYNWAFIDIINSLIGKQHELGLTEPIDFVFDKGNEERIVGAWDAYKASAPPATLKLLGDKPTFGNDEEVKPLQAADLLAWVKRRNFQKRQEPNLKTRKMPWVKTRELLYLDMEWTPARIQQAYDILQKAGAERVAKAGKN